MFSTLSVIEHHFSYDFVDCKCFEFDSVQKFGIWKRVDNWNETHNDNDCRIQIIDISKLMFSKKKISFIDGIDPRSDCTFRAV